MINWGDVPTWFAAGGTIAAFAVTGLQLRQVKAQTASLEAQTENLTEQTASLLRQTDAAGEQAAIMRDQHEDAAKAQARLITSRESLSQGTQVHFTVTNESDRSVNAFRVVSPYLGVDNPAAWRLVGMWLSTGPNTAAFNLDAAHSVAARNGVIALPANRHLRVAVEFLDEAGEAVPRNAGDPSESPSLDIEFVDASGRRWQRWANVEPRPATVSAVHREPPPALPERQ